MNQSTLKTSFGMNGTFQGVMLHDLLAAYGIGNAPEIILIAADGYAITLRRVDLQSTPALLATPFNGHPIDDPAKGPLIPVWPELEHAALAGENMSSLWIWSVIKIRPGQRQQTCRGGLPGGAAASGLSSIWRLPRRSAFSYGAGSTVSRRRTIQIFIE